MEEFGLSPWRFDDPASSLGSDPTPREQIKLSKELQTSILQLFVELGEEELKETPSPLLVYS